MCAQRPEREPQNCLIFVNEIFGIIFLRQIERLRYNEHTQRSLQHKE